MALKYALICLSLPSGLMYMYITSLPVDGCEYYYGVSFSSTQTVLYRIIKFCLTTLKYGVCLLYYMFIKQTFQYKTNGIYLQTRPK